MLSGVIAERFRASRIIILALALLCLLVLTGLVLVRDFLPVSLCLLLLGGCTVSIRVSMVAVALRAVPAQHQGKALRLISSGTSCGAFVNGLLISGLPEGNGWRLL